MYKLVAIDIDGTLVNDNKELTQKTIRAIKEAKENNVKIVLSSARAFVKIRDYLKELNLVEENQYTITFNGAVVVENKSEKVLFSNKFTSEEIYELIDISRKLDTNIFLYTMNSAYTEKVPSIIKNSKSFKNTKIENVNFNDINFRDNAIYKILFIDDYDKILKLRKELPQRLVKKYEITNSIPECLEFVNKGITKSKALNFICEKCNINNTEVVAIGDGDNDLQMINFAGLGVAMGNATAYLKEKSDYVTLSNNEDGVAKVIEEFIL